MELTKKTKKVEHHKLNEKKSVFDDNNSNKSSVVSLHSENCSGNERSIIKNETGKIFDHSIVTASKQAEDKKFGPKPNNSSLHYFVDDKKNNEESLNYTASKDDVNRNQGEDWQRKLEMLRDFYQKNGHSNVPSNKNCLDQHEFFMWINIQRTNYKYFYDGKPTCLTANQIVQLEKLGV